MITEKKMTLKPILESSEGIHLTAYLLNNGDLINLKAQLRETISETHQWLESVLTVEEKKKFLEPLYSLLQDASIFKNMKGNIGIFRTRDSFRILNVPVELERQCHVASSFHVKPLLRWMQTDREFLLLSLGDDYADLYLGTQTSLQKIDSLLFPEVFKQTSELSDYKSQKKSRQNTTRKEQTYTWICDWLDQLNEKTAPKLFISGERVLAEDLLRRLRNKNTSKTSSAFILSDLNLNTVCQIIRKTLKEEAKKTLEQALLEFHFADEINLTKKNIFQIAKAAVQGKIRKLIVADGLSVFGKMDRKTGGLAIHPFDLDHEDDDILDDLAQTVLASGGEVIVATQEEIPKGRPILAILEHRGSDIEKREVML